MLKVTIEEIPGAERELILRCPQADEEIRRMAERLGRIGGRVAVRCGEELRFLPPEEVYYAEAVEGNVFVYTAQAVYPTRLKVAQIQELSPDFFRCSKSMVVNLNQIAALRGELNGRLMATLANGERILISRHYAGPIRWALIQG